MRTPHWPTASILKAIALTLAIVPASASWAWARGGGWEPVPAGPVDFPACGTTVHVEFPVNKEYQRVVTLGGVEVTQVTGSLRLQFTNIETGREITVNVSGPSRSPTGGNEGSARGRSIVFLTPEDAARYGLPELFVSAGYYDVLHTTEGDLIQKFRGTVATDICKAITGPIGAHPLP